jgi:hypothetical protein
MTHEIFNAMVERRRDLPSRDGSAYRTLRMVIQRQGADSAIVSLLFTDAGGHRLSDTRLGLVTISTTDEVGAQLGPDQILWRALEALYRRPAR